MSHNRVEFRHFKAKEYSHTHLLARHLQVSFSLTSMNRIGRAEIVFLFLSALCKWFDFACAAPMCWTLLEWCAMQIVWLQLCTLIIAHTNTNDYELPDESNRPVVSSVAIYYILTGLLLQHKGTEFGCLKSRGRWDGYIITLSSDQTWVCSQLPGQRSWNCSEDWIKNNNWETIGEIKSSWIGMYRGVTIGLNCCAFSMSYNSRLLSSGEQGNWGGKIVAFPLVPW